MVVDVVVLIVLVVAVEIISTSAIEFRVKSM